MNKKRFIVDLQILIPLILLVFAGCAHRYENPVVLEDSTLFYPSKNEGDIEATLTLCTGFDKKTGEKTGVGNVFTIIEKENLLAFVDIKNKDSQKYPELLFHIDWVDSSNKSVYLKRIVLTPGDTLSAITSGISISPEKRQSGNYQIRVYLFRELLMVKNFALRSKSEVKSEIVTNISLSGKMNQSISDADSQFISHEKESIQATVAIEHLARKFDQELTFDLAWVGPDQKTFYRKQAVVRPGDTSFSVSTSISVSPDKRPPGKYAFRILLFDENIAEKRFEVLPKPLVVPQKEKNLEATITFCRKIDTETGEPIEANTIFALGENENVRAVVAFDRTSALRNRELKFRLDWIGPDGKTFYKKNIEISPDDPTNTINSSISAAPGKRQPGIYQLRVNLFDKKITEKTFELR